MTTSGQMHTLDFFSSSERSEAICLGLGEITSSFHSSQGRIKKIQLLGNPPNKNIVFDTQNSKKYLYKKIKYHIFANYCIYQQHIVKYLKYK